MISSVKRGLRAGSLLRTVSEQAQMKVQPPTKRRPAGGGSRVRKPRQKAPEGTLADSLYQSLKRAIIENRLHPGTILSEQTIAARNAVSRAPAREALKRLAVNRFVVAKHRVGYVVTSVSVADMDEIFAMRLRLEPMATELAVPRMTPSAFETLEKLASEV